MVLLRDLDVYTKGVSCSSSGTKIAPEVEFECYDR